MYSLPQRPSSKMSKSPPDLSSRILLTITAAQIKSKIQEAETDSMQGITYNPVNRPGASTLLTILAASTEEDVAEVATRYTTEGHGDSKNDVADAIEEMFRVPKGVKERHGVSRERSKRWRRESSGEVKSDFIYVRKLVGLA